MEEKETQETGVCCKLFKSLFRKNKEASKSISSKPCKCRRLEIMQASYIYTIRHSLNSFYIQKEQYTWLAINVLMNYSKGGVIAKAFMLPKICPLYMYY